MAAMAASVADTTMKKVSETKCFSGLVVKYQHDSTSTKTPMTFTVYLPPAALAGTKVPVLYWLSGLTCTSDNFTQKAGAFKAASEANLMVVVCDTSPRGAGVAGEDDSYDFGTGAGFYLDATVPAYATNYNMYTYVTKELPALVEAELPALAGVRSVAGHSMGGHGALTIAMKNPTFCAVSAFAPICNPSACPWGSKALTGYLGEDETNWKEYDACGNYIRHESRNPQ